MGRVTWRTKASYQAECQDCDWRAYERNAMGLAAQHFYRRGHKVRVEMERAYYFDPAGPPGLERGS